MLEPKPPLHNWFRFKIGEYHDPCPITVFFKKEISFPFQNGCGAWDSCLLVALGFCSTVGSVSKTVGCLQDVF